MVIFSRKIGFSRKKCLRQRGDYAQKKAHKKLRQKNDIWWEKKSAHEAKFRSESENFTIFMIFLKKIIFTQKLRLRQRGDYAQKKAHKKLP